MFEPLPGLIRLQRERRGLSQERLAKLAGVSRGQLIAFEKGEQNISLVFLIKLARALDLTNLPVAELNVHAAPPDLAMLIAGANALATARRIVDQAASSLSDLDAAEGPVTEFVDRLLGPLPEVSIARTTERLASGKGERRSTERALRELAESPSAVPRTSRSKAKPAAKAAARKRAR